MILTEQEVSTRIERLKSLALQVRSSEGPMDKVESEMIVAGFDLAETLLCSLIAIANGLSGKRDLDRWGR